MVKKRHFHQTKYPFNAYPFEAMCCGSWQAVERIRIKNGTLTFHLVDNQFMVLGRGPFSDVRIRSRKANLSDCTCLLRPGVDICVLTTSGSDLEDPKPASDLYIRLSNLKVLPFMPAVWIDAKISSIERKPHDYSCLCEFYVNFYTNKKPLGLGRGRLSKELNLVGIDQISILQKFQKKYCEDQYYRWDFSESTSLLPKTKILVGKFLSDISWLIVTSALKQISFDVRSIENKIAYELLGGDLENRSFDSNQCLNTVNFKVEDEKFVPLVIQVGSDDTVEVSPVSQTYENKLVPYYGGAELRRSKRRKVQPDRYLGCDSINELKIDHHKLRPYQADQCDYDEMTMPLSCLFGLKSSSPEDRTVHNRIKSSSSTTAASEKLIVLKKNSKAGEMKSSFSHKNKDKMELAIVPVPEHNELIAFDSYLHSDEMENNYSSQITEISPKYYYINTTRKVRRRKFIPDLEDMEFAKTWEGTSYSTKLQRASYHNMCSKGNRNGEERVYRKRSLGAGAYKDLINSFLKMADSTEKKEDPQIIDQWKEFKEKSRSDRRQEAEPHPNEEEQEMSENEMLWREMELSLASSYLSEDYEVSNAGFSTYTEKGSSNDCCHEYILNEELGILCHICGFVSTEIKNVTSPFMEYSSWNMEEKPLTENNAYREADDEEFDVSHGSDLSDPPVIEENENVWALIPEIRRKLHLHQRKAFEFLWQNIAGSIDPAFMKSASKKIGGCVVSHSPGAGKTFLIIAFLVSYLKLFPGKRPLVLAPKTTLYTWYKEFIKWEIPVPVHLIHGRRSYRVFRPKNVSFPGFGKPTDDVMHILDCLEKIQKWHAHPSVLVMGYTSFLTLMRDDSAFPHRKFMSRVLRESPGILILDEGHNPRSTKSRLRKGLMKIHTDLRILLSGTLFQNNFGEYFNTLCLARPKFVKEVLKELDPKYKRKNRTVQKAWSLQEARARKFFLDNIAKKIDSGVGEDRMKGLNMLRSLTNGFIDVYEGGNAECLPGLQIYTLLMNSTDMQKEILGKLHRAMERVVGFPLEIELLITLGSIHPSLVTSAVCAGKFFTEEELRGIGKSRFDLRKGSKVRFVLNLVHHIAKREKVLVFCHNIAPVKYFVDLFESFFRWKRGREVLTLTGDLELFERGKIMDTFEDPGSPSRVLLASITACAEGISLTAASRVILLDSEWNPSKTKQAIARAFRPGQQKVVYVYQLLMSGTLEEDKYRRTTWKEWVSSMIFSEAFVEDPSKWQAEKIEFEDDVLREIVEEDRSKSFHMILKNEKASTTIRGKD